MKLYSCDRLFRPYGQVFNQGVHIIWGMLIVVGMTNAFVKLTKACKTTLVVLVLLGGLY